jgi:hypothetical protein
MEDFFIFHTNSAKFGFVLRNKRKTQTQNSARVKPVLRSSKSEVGLALFRGEAI